MPVRVDIMHRRTETRKRMVESLGKTSVTERGVSLLMAVLGIEFQTQPLGEVRVEVGVDIEPLVADVRITEDTVFRICAPGYIIAYLVSTSAEAEVVVLLESEVLVMKVEIIGISDTAF